MAWTLLGFEFDLDLMATIITLAKTGVAAMAGYFSKAVWGLLTGKKGDSTMTKNCIIPACCRPASKRGLCLVCYSKAKKRIELSNNNLTWEHLVEKGLAESEQDPFDVAFEKSFKEDES